MLLRAHQLIAPCVSGVFQSSLLGGRVFLQRSLALSWLAMEKTGDLEKGCVE